MNRMQKSNNGLFCPPPSRVTIQDKLNPFIGKSIPFASIFFPITFGGDIGTVLEVAKKFVKVKDLNGRIRNIFFRDFSIIFFITNFPTKPPIPIAQIKVRMKGEAQPEPYGGLFESPVTLVERGVDFIELFLTDRLALIPTNQFVNFRCLIEEE